MNIKSNLSSLILALLISSFPLIGLAQTAETSSGETAETEIQDNTPDVDMPVEPQIQEIKIDEDELPGESVTPKTDISNNVVNKKIKFTKHFLFDVATGSILDEPLLNSNYFLVRASYYINEEFSFGLGFKSRFGGKTSYAQQLYDGTAKLEFERAPSPTQSHFLSLGYNFYYGKMSFSKNVVIPAATKLEGDFGMQKIGSSNKPFIQTAVSQSFFLNRYVSLGLSIGLSLAQSIDSTSVNIRSTQPLPQESDFSEKSQFNQYLSANLSFLL